MSGVPAHATVLDSGEPLDPQCTNGGTEEVRANLNNSIGGLQPEKYWIFLAETVPFEYHADGREDGRISGISSSLFCEVCHLVREFIK